MPKTQVTEQADLSGGFNPTTDPLKTKPNEWIIASNVIISKPGGDANLQSTNIGSVISTPLMRTPPSASVPNFAYSPVIPNRIFVARLDNTEDWVFTANSGQQAYFSTPISQGNNSIEIDGSGGGSGIALLQDLYFTSPISIPASSLSPVLCLDATEANFSGTGTLDVYLYDGSGNYAHFSYSLNSSTPPPAVLQFTLITYQGGLNINDIIHLNITFNLTSSSTCNIKLSDLRFEGGIALGQIVSASAFGQGTTALDTTGAIITNLTGTSVMAVSSDALLIGIYPFSYWIKLKTGLTNLPILGGNNPIEGTRVYFAEYPNPINPNENIMAVADGSDNSFTYNPNAEPGYQFSDLIQVPNNVQVITPSTFPASGTYTLTLNTMVTGTLNWNDPQETIQSAIEALPNVGIGNALVNGFLGSQSAGNPTGYTVTFGGNLSGLDPGAITVTDNSVKDITATAVTFTVTPEGTGSYEDATPASGSFCYEYKGDITVPLAWNATASTIQTALNNLATITSDGGVTVASDLTPKIVISFNTGASSTQITVVNSELFDADGNQIFVNNVITTGVVYVNQQQSFQAWSFTSTQDQPVTYTDPAFWRFPVPNIDGTANITPSYSTSQLQASLDTASNVGSGNSLVTGAFNNPVDIVVEFVGALQGTNLPLVTLNNNYTVGMDDWKTGGGTSLGPGLFVQTRSASITGQIQTTNFSVSPSSDLVWRYVETYKNMMTVCGSDKLPMTLRPSQIDGYTDFDITGQNDVTLNATPGERITGQYDMDNYLLISTNKTIWNLYGSNPDSTTGDFDLVRSKSLVGVIEKGAGIRVGGGFYFYDGNDFYLYNGSESVSLTKGKLKSALAQIPINQKRAVVVSYDSQRNILIWGLPQIVAGYQIANALTFSLDNGAWGVMGPNGPFLTNFGGPYTIGVEFQTGTPSFLCGVDLNSDGTVIRPVFIAFGNTSYEFDPPIGTATNFLQNMCWMTAFNFCKTPHMTKDFMRCILTFKNLVGVDSPGSITLFFLSDNNPTDVRQVITGLQPINGKIDVLLNGVAGESIAVGAQVTLGNADNSPIEISGYLVYWQIVEDL